MMGNTSVRPTDDIEIIMRTFGNMPFRLCLITLGNASDAEDAVEEILIKYLQKAPEFKNAEHEKAWLITVATNKWKDILRFKNRHQVVNIDPINEFTKDTSDIGIIDALMTLNEKFRIVIFLYYVGGYSIDEIARVIGRTSSAVKIRLQKGRRLLEEAYRKEYM